MVTCNVREAEQGITIVGIGGRLNLGPSLTEVETQLLDAIKNGARKVVVDLSELSYMDSASIGMLAACRKEMDQVDGKIRIAGAKGLTARTFEIVRMNSIIPTDPDVATSVAALAA